MGAQNYKETINLPKTDFPQQANLVKMEPALRERWEKENIYAKIVAARKSQPKWILHDGPPYANGDVHIGTAQNKILKDIVVKFHTMQGQYSPYVPGWDCHGLPIEHKVMKDLGEKARSTEKSEVRRLCQDFAMKFIDIQRRQFKSLGIFGDWEKPYLTLSPDYELGIIEVFEELQKKGQIYRGLKSIKWCLFDRTALAEAEVEYKTRKDTAIYVAFESVDDSSLDYLVWTTTPWTLPGNVAVAVHPLMDYVVVKRGARKAVIAKALYETKKEDLGLGEIVGAMKGAEIDKKKYKHPLFGHACPVVLAEYVTTTDGTGLVHTAPGHGEDDFETGLRHKLPIVSPVDPGGFYTDEAKEWKGQRVFEANPKVVEWLRAKGTLVKDGQIDHEYAHCWRCKNPIIYRATEQWFIAVDKNDGRARALKAVKETKWVPGWGETRISSMIEQRPDWCISRQRTWGVPIPVFYCEKCNKEHFDFEAVKSLFRKGGANAWFTNEAKEILPPGTKCGCGNATFRKEQDILDVWFESGASHRGVLMKHPELHFPAEVYLEGTDQHRGWFQSSLLASLLSNGQAPFKTVVTHGFVVDARTRDKISKSNENTETFLLKCDDMVQKFGADLIRLWISSIDFREDLPFSRQILEGVAEPYRKYRNTFRYLLGNIHDFDPAKDAVPLAEMEKVDRWALGELSDLVTRVTQYYENYEYFRATKALNDFCVVTMSSQYFDILKDSLYTLGKKSKRRRSGQTALREILLALVKMYAPILAHTCEEIWGYIPGVHETESVHLALWPKAGVTPDLEQFRKLLEVRNAVNKKLEELRQAGGFGKSLEAVIDVKVPADVLATLKSIDAQEFFIVSEVNLSAGDLTVEARKSTYPKCERCWNFRATVGKDATHPTLCDRCVAALNP